MSNIGIKVCMKQEYRPKSTDSPQIAIYKPESNGVQKHPRKAIGYVSKNSDGSITIERTDGKRIRMVLP